MVLSELRKTQSTLNSVELKLDALSKKILDLDMVYSDLIKIIEDNVNNGILKVRIEEKKQIFKSWN